MIMKFILKFIVTTLFLLLMSIAFVIAVIRSLFYVIFIFTWDESSRLYGKILESIAKIMLWVK